MWPVGARTGHACAGTHPLSLGGRFIKSYSGCGPECVSGHGRAYTAATYSTSATATHLILMPRLRRALGHLERLLLQPAAQQVEQLRPQREVVGIQALLDGQQAAAPHKVNEGWTVPHRREQAARTVHSSCGTSTTEVRNCGSHLLQ